MILSKNNSVLNHVAASIALSRKLLLFHIILCAFLLIRDFKRVVLL